MAIKPVHFVRAAAILAILGSAILLVSTERKPARDSRRLSDAEMRQLRGGQSGEPILECRQISFCQTAYDICSTQQFKNCNPMNLGQVCSWLWFPRYPEECIPVSTPTGATCYNEFPTQVVCWQSLECTCGRDPVTGVIDCFPGGNFGEVCRPLATDFDTCTFEFCSS